MLVGPLRDTGDDTRGHRQKPDRSGLLGDSGHIFSLGRYCRAASYLLALAVSRPAAQPEETPLGVGPITLPCLCVRLASGPTVRLGQDRRGCALESGTGRIVEVPRIDQREQADHQVNPGGAGGKWLEGEEAGSELGVEKHADEGSNAHRFLHGVVRYPGGSYG